MGQMMIRSDGRVGGTSYAEADLPGTLTLPAVSPEQLVGALALVIRDLVNELRALGVVGLVAYSEQDLIDKMRAKL